MDNGVSHPAGGTARVILALGQDASLRRQWIQNQGLPGALAALRSWQSARLQRTYQDILEDPEFAPACGYFLNDIYAARDFSQRDHDLEHLYQILGRFFPPQSLKLIREIIELNQLSADLDIRLLQALVAAQGASELPADLEITPESYAQAYRACENRPERVYQIESLTQVLYLVGEGARSPLVGSTLLLARGPAILAGWGEFYDLLWRGYRAFKHLHGGRKFASLIYQRETQISDNLFASAAQPFQIENH